MNNDLRESKSWEKMTVAPDPGGHFKSDAHRRLLAHLPVPDASQGLSPTRAFQRQQPDDFLKCPDVEHTAALLKELEDEGLAENGQMTQKGFDLLTGPNANEPPADVIPESEIKARERANEIMAEEDRKLEEEGSGHD